MNFMDLNWRYLQTLVAILDEGTFDAAAHTLGVSPSAVSQRIRTLEASAGSVLVVRSTPCRLTPQGELLVRLGRQIDLLGREAQSALRTGTGRSELTVAVNADSLATWFVKVLAEVAHWPDVSLRLTVDDQDHTAALLRSGSVLGAVTSQATAVQGCSAQPIGVVRYVPVAAPSLLARYGDDLRRLPVVEFDAKDALQQRILARAAGPRPAEPPAEHRVPSSQGFAEAVRVGLGWGTLPQDQLGDDLRAGRLVRLTHDHEDVPLYWHRWRLDSPTLSRLTEAVLLHAPR